MVEEEEVGHRGRNQENDETVGRGEMKMMMNQKDEGLENRMEEERQEEERQGEEGRQEEGQRRRRHHRITRPHRDRSMTRTWRLEGRLKEVFKSL